MHPMVNIALRAARSAGEIIVRASDRLDTVNVEAKDINDFVSDVDKASEQEIVYQLQKAYPEHQIRAEESGLIPPKRGGNEAEFCWVIDPLDGTTNFVRGIPHYAISIACLHKGRMEHAVIYDPVRREEFTATRGSGAQLNGRRIRVTGRKGLDGALLATGIPYKNRQDQHLDAYLQSLQILASQTAGIRRAGAAALDLAYVAAGRVDGFWEIALQEWDIAAGVLLVTEAGGLVSDFSGGNNYLKNGNIVAAAPKVFKPLLQVAQQKLGYLEQ